MKQWFTAGIGRPRLLGRHRLLHPVRVVGQPGVDPRHSSGAPPPVTYCMDVFTRRGRNTISKPTHLRQVLAHMLTYPQLCCPAPRPDNEKRASRVPAAGVGSGGGGAEQILLLPGSAHCDPLAARVAGRQQLQGGLLQAAGERLVLVVCATMYFWMR